MKIGVISDTHIPVRARGLPAAVFEVFDGVDVILHAGDFLELTVLEELQAFAPTHGVLGNMDEWSLRDAVPEKVVLELGGMKVGMIHDSGPSAGRRKRIKRAFPGTRVVVFGHSHQPLIDDDGDLLMLNSGSACDPRRAKVPTVALLTLEDALVSAEMVEL